MSNNTRCPEGVDPLIWKQYRTLSEKTRATFCHGNFGEYQRLRKVGRTLGLARSSDIVKALVDLYCEDYADRMED